MFFVQYRTLTDKLGFFSVKNPQEIIFIGKLSILKFSLLKRSRKSNWLAKRKRIISSFIVKKQAGVLKRYDHFQSLKKRLIYIRNIFPKVYLINQIIDHQKFILFHNHHPIPLIILRLFYHQNYSKTSRYTQK